MSCINLPAVRIRDAAETRATLEENPMNGAWVGFASGFALCCPGEQHTMLLDAVVLYAQPKPELLFRLLSSEIKSTPKPAPPCPPATSLSVTSALLLEHLP